ncbi:ABC transporter permease [Acetobacterium carbinolicum]|uniref:ABC transporter permease n=1 Tax=Acetobacterium carbinolicum TaxID=52690 RepID=UPI0039BF968D
MRLFLLECKRVFTSRMAIGAMTFSLIVSLFLSFSMINGIKITDRDINTLYKGAAALDYARAIAAPNEGEMTPEKLIAMNDLYVVIENKYGDGDMKNVPEEIYQEKIRPIRDFINVPGLVYKSTETGVTIPPKERTSEMLTHFYIARDAALPDFIRDKYTHDAEKINAVMEINTKLQTPFYYASTLGWNDALENIGFIILLLAFAIVLVTSSVFSSDYQTDADAIQRTTKKGRLPLGLSKIGTSLLFAVVSYFFCIGLMTAIFMYFCGTEGLRASVQVVEPMCIAPMTFRDLLKALLMSGLLTILAITAFSLLVSSRTKTPVVSLIISVAMILAPTVIVLISMGDMANWIRLCLPSGGLGVMGTIYYEIMAYVNILKIGTVTIWSPNVVLVAPIVLIPILIIFTLRSYIKFQN